MDGWLLATFPGRTLEELDSMDWGRFVAAQNALYLRQIEEKRMMQIQKLIKFDQMSQAEIEAIAHHEEILARWPANLE